MALCVGSRAPAIPQGLFRSLQLSCTTKGTAPQSSCLQHVSPCCRLRCARHAPQSAQVTCPATKDSQRSLDRMHRSRHVSKHCSKNQGTGFALAKTLTDDCKCWGTGIWLGTGGLLPARLRRFALLLCLVYGICVSHSQAIDL